MKASSRNPLKIKVPESVLTFTDREIDLAHQLIAKGINWEPAPGMTVYDDQERYPDTSPIQNHVYIILDYKLFVQIAGSVDKLKKEWTWLPSWEEGRQWLKSQGINDAEILDRIRERILDAGLSDREALYELMVQVLSPSDAET